MKILMLGYIGDAQTGLYIMNSLKLYAKDVAAVDVRKIISDMGATEESQQTILDEIADMKIDPDIILILKGLEIKPETLKKIKEKYSKAYIVNWMFDKYVGGMPVWKNKNYIKFIELHDMFLCSLKGVADKLKIIGLDNVHYLPEACDLKFHGRTYMNFYQEEKYGEDIAFIGSLGYLMQHANRIPILTKIAREGFRMKIWGKVICDWKLIPQEIKDYHMLEEAINVGHSKVAQTSLINIGIDQDPELDLGQSARLYRIMCAGGMYLSTATKGLDKMFKINRPGEPITDDLELVVFYDLDDLVEKLDFLLEFNDIRKKIAENGKKVVHEKHTFDIRCKELLDVIKKKRKEKKGDKSAKPKKE